MAYTKIHAIKATVDKAIEYICNPDITSFLRMSFFVVNANPVPFIFTGLG